MKSLIFSDNHGNNAGKVHSGHVCVDENKGLKGFFQGLAERLMFSLFPPLFFCQLARKRNEGTYTVLLLPTVLRQSQHWLQQSANVLILQQKLQGRHFSASPGFSFFHSIVKWSCGTALGS